MLKLLEVVPEVVVNVSVGVVPEVVTGTGLVDTDGTDAVLLGVVSSEDGPEVVVITMADDVAGVLRVESVWSERVVLVVNSVSVTAEVVAVSGVVDIGGGVTEVLPGPEVVVLTGVVCDPVGGLGVLVVMVSRVGVSVTGVVLVDVEGVGPEVVVLGVDVVLVTSEVVTVSELVDIGDVVCRIVVLPVIPVLPVSVILVVDSGVAEGVTGVLVFVGPTL
ncbi:hypothetical protein WISP_144086 [Willisornis vidua]|uniref:Uncharacterized protein n=1 Tax=Willisornis vidua TaxID=1566151 RepID=A0ABQ9CM98_9PASS|nr:hypothetical protein WISP_144086 [Willisornis vidua]